MEKCLAGSDDIPLRLTVREISDKVCVAYGIPESELTSPSQSRNISEARAVLGWLVRALDCATLSETGRFVSRDVGSISSAVRRLSNRMREAPKLAEKVRQMKENLGKLIILEA